VEGDLTSNDGTSDDLLNDLSDDLLLGAENWWDPSSEEGTKCREAGF
jgi:hypothetical protein